MCSMRQEVIELLNQEDRETAASERFVKIALEARHCLESPDLQQKSRFYLPPDLMFNGECSPNYDLFSECLRSMFSSARNALHSSERNENFSGLAVSGMRGTGKSVLLQTLAVLGGLLLPNAQTVYVNAQSLPTSRCLLEYLQSSLDAIGVVEGNDEDDGNVDMSSVIAQASRRECALFLMIDELPELYTKDYEADWRDLCSFLTSTGPSFAFVSGSSSALPAVVRNRSEAEITGADKKYLAEFPSLNDTKLQVRPMHPLHTLSHYQTYFKDPRRGSIGDLQNLPTVNSSQASEEDLFTRMHLLTGGNLRMIRQYLRAPESFFSSSAMEVGLLELPPELAYVHR